MRDIDRTGERFFHIAGWWWAVIVGYIIGLSTSSVGGRYFSMFLMTIGYSGKLTRNVHASLFARLTLSFVYRIRTHAGMGVECYPQTARETCCEYRHSQWVW